LLQQLGVLSILAFTAAAEEIGDVSTVFKLLGANHKIVVEALTTLMFPVLLVIYHALKQEV
jgi:catabolite regulation protein CreA